MKSLMPDYFLALMKQYGNLRSADEAGRVAQVISDALEASLSETTAKQVFDIMPRYLRPQGQRFYARLFDWQPKYQHTTMLSRVELSLNLTDPVEVNSYLSAYFSSIKTLLDHDDQLRLSSLLPDELARIYLRA